MLVGSSRICSDRFSYSQSPVWQCLSPMAEVDEISRLEGRFLALITYIMSKKILARASTILYRLEFITVSESVGKRCKRSHGGT